MNVVITGASSGIGRALAQTFARNGHPVLAVARREDRLKALCSEMIKEKAATVHYQALDISAPGAAQTLLNHAVNIFGQVHILINNAGISPYQKFRELDYKLMRQTIILNVLALTELCHLFMDHMLSHSEPSHVVNVGSVGGYSPLPNFAVYSASKHYVRILSNLLNREYRATNIKVSALHPGGTQTEFLELAGEKMKKSAEKTLMTPERVAEIAYPAIMKGKRVIIPGFINKIAVFMGKFFPFPLAIRITEFIYNSTVDPTTPTYSTEASTDETIKSGASTTDTIK
jgi:short-subunit dehydrogenase